MGQMLSLAYPESAATAPGRSPSEQRKRRSLMMRARVGLVGVLLAGIALEPLGAAPRQQAAQQTAQPTDPSAQQPNPQTTFRSRVDSVLVDVSVTDKQGRPVTDL